MTDNLRKFCIAPMMGYTTPHARNLYRILSKKTFLFTEMIPAKTMLYSEKKDSVIENNHVNPIALQVGGSEYQDLIKCAKIAENYNFNEINLNVGCPSKTVQKGGFGACLMKEKTLVRDCLNAMASNTNIDVSMKCRIGIGDTLNYDFFHEFIDETIKSGIKIIYVHARNAILNGLNPKNNRTFPPLNYEFVAKIKKVYPHIQFILNGGINNLNDAYNYSKKFDGVMLGRLIQSNPFCLLNIDKLFFNSINDDIAYQKIIFEYFEYIKKRIKQDSIYRLLSPLLHIFFAVTNGKKIKSEINASIKNYEVDKLEFMFLKFMKEQRVEI